MKNVSHQSCRPDLTWKGGSPCWYVANFSSGRFREPPNDSGPRWSEPAEELLYSARKFTTCWENSQEGPGRARKEASQEAISSRRRKGISSTNLDRSRERKDGRGRSFFYLTAAAHGLDVHAQAVRSGEHKRSLSSLKWRFGTKMS